MESRGCIHLALIDPEKPGKDLPETARKLESFGTTAIMVGGSTVASPSQLDIVVKSIKDGSTLPIILFPNGLTGISRFADAIFFMSLLNSTKAQYITGAQTLGAPVVKRFKLEPIPLGYILVGSSNTAVSSISDAALIPYTKPDLAASYALAAQYLGMRFVYLEAGSGALQPVGLEMVQRVAEEADVPVIVGGGIRTAAQATRIAKAGASAVVTGTILEQEGAVRAGEIVTAIRRA